MAMQALLDEFEEILESGDEGRLAALSERLWKYRRRLPDLIVERFHADRVKQPRVAFELIRGMAGGRAPAVLKRIAADRAVEDIVRWGARRRAGWAIRGQPKARREFLATLADADATLLLALAQAEAGQLADGEIVQEVLAYVQAFDPARRRAFVQQALAQDVRPLPWLLRCLIHLDADPGLQMACISALVTLANSEAVGALDRAVRLSRNAAVRDEAAAAARRLRFQLVQPETAAAAFDEQMQPQLERVRLSSVDGDGSQLLILTRTWAPRQYLNVMVYLNDAEGIRDVFGVFRQVQPEPVDASLDEMLEPPMIVDVDLPEARGALAAGEAALGRRGKLPLHYELWQPYFHDRFPASAAERLVPAELDDAPYARRHDLASRCGELLDHPAFTSWLADPDLLVESLGPRLPRTKGRIPKSLYAQLATSLFSEEELALLRGRLRKQAWLLDRVHEVELRDIALAAAASLDRASQQPRDAHPLLRGMIDRALDVCLIDSWIGLY
jgi:hypothetical protein